MTGFGRRRERGAGLFIVILLAACLAAIGITLLTLTLMGPRVSGSLRDQEEAFNAAEAGFGAARLWVEDKFANGIWTNFSGHYVTQPTNIDKPFLDGVVNAGYFRRLTDEALFQAFDSNGDGTPEVTNLLSFRTTFATAAGGGTDSRLTYTAFLIDDEAGGGTPDASDALLVVIGAVRAGARILATSRLEIVIAYQTQGTGAPSP